MVKAWIAKINSLYFKEKYESCYQLLPEWRKEKADRLRDPKAKAQSAGVWTLWMEIRKRERLPEDAVFNLSHSGDYVMCACSDRRDVQVGCDLEMIGETREKVARRFFCQEEYIYIIGDVLPILGVKRKFYESHTKRNGAGYQRFLYRMG